MVSGIGHETAHQWFAHLVTAAWWDDVWLNEDMATWIEEKALAAFDPGLAAERSRIGSVRLRRRSRFRAEDSFSR